MTTSLRSRPFMTWTGSGFSEAVLTKAAVSRKSDTVANVAVCVPFMFDFAYSTALFQQHFVEME